MTEYTEYPSVAALFCDCPHLESDQAALSRIRVQSARIDRARRVMDVTLLDQDGKADDTLILRLERQLGTHYALQHVKIATAGPRPASAASSSPSSGNEPKQPSITWGRQPKGAPVPMDRLAEHQGSVVVEGDVFSVESRPSRNGNGIYVSFDMTDYTDSVRVALYIKNENLGSLAVIEKGLRLRVGGRMEEDSRDKAGGSMILRPSGFAAVPRALREDTSPAGKRVELHLHTRMSALDATTDVSAAIETAARWGHAAIALTDHGVLHAFPDALAAQTRLERYGKHSVKVIYGCEGYLVEDDIASAKGKVRSWHIIILARDKTGLFNLYKLVSLAHIEHFKSRPCIPRGLLQAHREGLVLGSACERGELFTAVVAGVQPEELLSIASFYDYLEIQPLCNNAFMLRNGMARDVGQLEEHNRTILSLGRKLGKPVAATGDVHFLEPEDEIYRSVILAAKKMPDADQPLPLYFKTTDEMLREFSYLGEDESRRVVIDDPNEIASWCSDISPIAQGEFFPKMEGSAEELRTLSHRRATELYGEKLPPVLAERMKTELDAIIAKGYDIIYMTAVKLVARSLREGYLVGSRGSVGSSVVAFLSGITEVNALPPHYRCPGCKHWSFDTPAARCGPDLPDAVCPQCGAPLLKDGFDIPFATFLGFEADKKPDIDLNFSGEYQAKAHQHAVELFGEGKVFRAGTIGTLAKKTATGFVLNYLKERGRVASDAEVSRLSYGCVGVKRTTGQHPGGLIILPSDKEIYEFCPVQHPAGKAGDIKTTHFDFHSIEENLLKLDLLGHDDPTMIKFLEELTGIPTGSIPLDDPGTMSLFRETESIGLSPDPLLGKTGACAIPEFGTRFVREMLTITKPRTFDELVRISGLSHGTDVWLGNAAELIKGGLATLGEVICCRDDIMGFLISKGLDRKTAFTIMESVRRGRGLIDEWEAAMRAASVPGWYIESCKKIKYMFPKAHAVAYVLMAFRIAWYKVHHPLAFYAAYFSIRAGAFEITSMTHGRERVLARIRDLERLAEPTAVQEDELSTLEVCYEYYTRGFDFLPLDIRVSHPTRFMPEDGALRPPFVSLPGLGETAARDIETERRQAAFLSVDDLKARCAKVSKTHVEQLLQEGAFGDLPQSMQLTLF